ncbi:MAG TPA: hypothetical protein VKP64_13630 [Mycobacteriales bacterium]|nr:hypothetical protein [Mycobacteriales bacterium]
MARGKISDSSSQTPIPMEHWTKATKLVLAQSLQFGALALLGVATRVFRDCLELVFGFDRSARKREDSRASSSRPFSAVR